MAFYMTSGDNRLRENYNPKGNWTDWVTVIKLTPEPIKGTFIIEVEKSNVVNYTANGRFVKRYENNIGYFLMDWESHASLRRTCDYLDAGCFELQLLKDDTCQPVFVDSFGTDVGLSKGIERYLKSGGSKQWHINKAVRRDYQVQLRIDRVPKSLVDSSVEVDMECAKMKAKLVDKYDYEWNLEAPGSSSNSNSASSSSGSKE